MGFRDPITSLSATQITPGVLPTGVKIAADQVLAGTLVGSTIETALSGRRVQITAPQTNPLAIEAFSGDSQETASGGMLADVELAVPANPPGDQGRLLLRANKIGSGSGAAELRLYSSSRDNLTPTRASLTATNLYLIGTVIAPTLSDPILNGYRIRQASPVVTTDVAGNVDVPYGTPFPNSTINVVAINGDGTFSPSFTTVQITNLYPDRFRCRVLNAAGNGIGSTPVRINYIAWGN
ncbi:MAG: hypothetical protein BGO38_06990 [Cellulomonas sp. 73-145]|uniref:hypothetical protein n=1 Tax=Cellulomonas sp. 73-145 TaxID=1895739 RepID=UPI0009270A91|nr:hypothetical protein [Cellulomonas sp. 73-145]MBN9327978.1 hypothetical protein [Cellulomonas sp.]OJV57962.1 MAG: hypothetical protein BGO38_06990 [Cellulomonas sp. 73-145]